MSWQDEINHGQVSVNMSVPLEIDPIPESPDLPTLGGNDGPIVQIDNPGGDGEDIPTDSNDGGMVVVPPPPLTQIPQDGLLIWPNGNFVNAIYYQNYGNQLGEPFLLGVRLEDLDFEYSVVSQLVIESYPGLVHLGDVPLSLANPQPGTLGYFMVPEPSTHAFLMIGVAAGWLGVRLKRSRRVA